MPRNKMKPEYDAELIMQMLMDEVVSLYVPSDGHGLSIRQIAEELDMTILKVRKILISAGVFSSKICDQIIELKKEGKEIPEIQKISLLDERIEQAVKITNAKLVIFDPIQSFIPTDCDMQSASKMRSVMRKINKIAEKYSCAVIMVGHLNKSSSGKKIYRGLGSIDITAIARSVLMIVRDADNPEIRYMYPVKSSLAPEGSAISFLMDKEKGFHWIGKCQLMQNEHHPISSQAISKKERAKEILKIILSAGMVKSNDILARMEELGISARTVRAAQKELGVTARRKNNVWFWELPSAQEEVGCERNGER